MEKEKLVSLVVAVQQGEEQAATELYNAFHKELYYYICKTADDSALAEDLLQETFIEIFQTIGQLNEPAAFVSWSRQIAYHRCTAYFRKRRELLADEDEDGNSVFDNVQEERAEFIPDEALDKEDLKQTIHAMIATLPMEQRSALLLRYFDELSVKEIADIQGVSEGTVKSRLNYGRKAIQKSVEDYEKKNGIKLHCVAIVPLLLWLFREYAISNGITRGAGSAAAAYTAAAAGNAANAAIAAAETAGAASVAAETAAVATETAVATAETAGAASVAAETAGAAAVAAETVGTATAVAESAGAAAIATEVTASTTSAAAASAVAAGVKTAGKFAVTKLIAGIVAAAVVVGGVVTATLLNKKTEKSSTPTVNLNDYIVITEKGYDGYGTIESWTIDYEALAEKYGHRAKNSKIDDDGSYMYVLDKENYPDWTGAYFYSFGNDVTTAEEAAKAAFELNTPRIYPSNYWDDFYDYEVQEQWDLMSNGDVIDFVWKYDDSRLEALETIFDIDIVWNKEGYQYTMHNLEPAKEYTGPNERLDEVKKTVYLKDYAYISLYGMDSDGQLSSAYIDSSSLINDIFMHTAGWYDSYTLKKTLQGMDNHNIQVFTLVADKDSDLSNGDVINFHWVVNERGLRLLQEQVPNITFDYSDFSYEVTGLEGVIEIDPFADLENGIKENVHIDCHVSESELSGSAVIDDWGISLRHVGRGTYGSVEVVVDTMDHTGYWSNGDQVKITIVSSDEDILEKFGLILTQKTGIYTITFLREPQN